MWADIFVYFCSPNNILWVVAENGLFVRLVIRYADPLAHLTLSSIIVARDKFNFVHLFLMDFSVLSRENANRIKLHL